MAGLTMPLPFLSRTWGVENGTHQKSRMVDSPPILSYICQHVDLHKDFTGNRKARIWLTIGYNSYSR
jgi:hypothetical protein